MTNNTTTSLAIGTILHGEAYDYKIMDVLGQGTFGITYKAKVEMKGALGRLDSNMYVAVKEFFMKEINGRENSSVTSGSTSNGGLFYYYRDKFEREARNLSTLSHPNIVKVLEAFHANGTTYYSMEYIDGISLDKKIAQSPQGRMPLTEAIETLKQISAAIAFMHSRNMLHLDVKPGNVMMRKDGTAVLIDFGLSKQYTSDGEPESSTKVGAGTPGYAPIEQASYHEGKGFPTMMDVYALGGTLFKMLTGQRPPEASEILNEGFPTDSLRQLFIPDNIVNSISKAMAPLKKDRWQTVDEFVNHLDEHGEHTIYEDTSSENARSESTIFDDRKFSHKLQGDPIDARQSNHRYASDHSADIEDDDEDQTESWFTRNKVVCAVAALLIALVVGLYVTNSRTDKEPQTAVTEQPTQLADSIAASQEEAGETTDGKVADNNETRSDGKPTNSNNNDGHTSPSQAASRPNKTTQNGQKEPEPVRSEPLNKPQPVNSTRVYDVVEQMPSFPGGISGLMTYLNQNTRYPAVAQENGVQGRVVVSFVVGKDGHISDVTVLRSVDPSLDKEAIRVVRNMPRWTPGKQGGEPVRVRYNVPVSFRLN